MHLPSWHHPPPTKSHSFCPSKGRTVWSQLSSQRSCLDARRFSLKLWSLPSGVGNPKKSICKLKKKKNIIILHFRLILASPALTLNYTLWSGPINSEQWQYIKCSFQLQIHIWIEARPVTFIRQSITFRECKIGTYDSTFVVIAAGKEKSVKPLPLVVLQVHLSPWRSDRFHCVSQVHVNCEQKSQKKTWDKKERVGHTHLRSCIVTSKETMLGYL